MGLLVSMLSGVFSGVISWAADLTWKQAVIMVIVAVAKDGQLYLAKHPADEIIDTVFIPKPSNPTTVTTTTEVKNS